MHFLTGVFLYKKQVLLNYISWVGSEFSCDGDENTSYIWCISTWEKKYISLMALITDEEWRLALDGVSADPVVSVVPCWPYPCQQRTVYWDRNLNTDLQFTHNKDVYTAAAKTTVSYSIYSYIVMIYCIRPCYSSWRLILKLKYFREN